MATWVGAIIETAGRADFWAIARKHGVVAETQDIPKHVLVDCDVGFDFEASLRLAEELSRELGTTAIGFVVQTTADVHELHAFENGSAIRRLAYCRDEGGWLREEGTPQPWESVYFGPDMLADDSDEEGLHAMHPSSTEPMIRVCEYFEIEGDRPHARWKKRSLLSRLFGR